MKCSKVMRWLWRLCCQCGVSLTLPMTLQAEPVDPVNQTIRIAMLQEPPTLDSTRATDLVSFFVLGHINEGLIRYDQRGRQVAGVAESWEVAPGQITFRLREDARWHDGSNVTAADFVYAWRRVNDPVTASPFAAIMHPLKNAIAVQAGTVPPTQLGVSATDDRTLVVELERPCGYCLNLMAHSVFFPLKQSFVEAAADSYAADSRQLLANGPFVLREWVHEATLTFEKNPHYWNRDAISLNRIEVKYITGDNRTRLNLFRDNQIAFARLGAETVKEAASEGRRIRTFLSGGVAYVWFNHGDDRPTRNLQLRQAIQAAFDPDAYVNQVIAIPGYKPTSTLFPGWFRLDGRRFVDAHPPPAVPRGRARARSLLAEASATLGDIPPLTILTVTSTTGVKAAEYFQGLLSQVLGIDSLVDQQTFKQYLSKARAGDFDLVLSSWYPDFDDLVTYADLLASYNPNNRGRFVSPAYDESLAVLIRESDPETRMAAAARLQRIIVDEVPLLPNAETSSAYLQHPKLRGVVRRVFGPDPDFTHARVID